AFGRPVGPCAPGRYGLRTNADFGEAARSPLRPRRTPSARSFFSLGPSMMVFYVVDIITNFAIFIKSRLDAARLRRTRTVMRHRRRIFNGKDIEAVVDERADRRVAAGTDALHDDRNVLRA